MAAFAQRPAVFFRRWGGFCLVVIVLALLAGCAGRRRDGCAQSLVLQLAANPDSLGLTEYLALPPAEQKARRSEAAHLVSAARKADRADIRLAKLNTAAGLAPDEVDYWLALADLWRWLGDYLQTDDCLVNAAAAVREMDPAASGGKDKETAAVATALQRAWLHYDRAEWRDAMPWVRAALRAEPGNEAALQIRGLLEGVQNHSGQAEEIANDLRRKDGFSTDIAWIHAALDGARGQHRSAFNAFLDLHPDVRRVAECYRDMGRAAERVGEWSYALRWYGESAAAIPDRKTYCLTRRLHERVSGTAGGPQLPFWLVRGNFYATGSISAYLGFAFGRFETAVTAADRNLWGGLVVNAAGICLRLDMEKTAARRVRGLVFAHTDRPDRALKDLQSVLADSALKPQYRVKLEAEIGHLLLVQKRSAEAVAYLRRALALDDGLAGTWSDLGLALIMARESAGAEEALSRALELDPNLAAAWYNRGLMHLHAGELDQAESDLGQAARLAPDNMDVANLLQQVRQQKRRSQ